jgi:general secretion pathway protein B
MPTTDRPGAVKPAQNAALVGTPAAPAKPATPPPASAATATAPAGKPTAPKAGVETKPAAPMKAGVGDKATASQPNPTPRDANAKAPAPDTKARAPAPEAMAAADAKVDARPATAKPAAPTLPSVWELPYGTRKELPDLQLTMHVYSSVPAERFVVIEGARHVEGDDLGNGVVLHEISTDGMVLDFKGQRFLYPRDGR